MLTSHFYVVVFLSVLSPCLGFDSLILNTAHCETIAIGVDDTFSRCPHNKFGHGLNIEKTDRLLIQDDWGERITLECCLLITNQNEYLTFSEDKITNTDWLKKSDYDGFSFSENFVLTGVSCRGKFCDEFKLAYSQPLLRDQFISLGVPKVRMETSDKKYFVCEQNEIMSSIETVDNGFYPKCQTAQTTCPVNTTLADDILDRCLCMHSKLELANNCHDFYCQKSCIECPIGHYCTDGLSYPCEAGSFCVNGVSETCPIGTTSTPKSQFCEDLPPGCQVPKTHGDRSTCVACDSDYYLTKGLSCKPLAPKFSYRPNGIVVADFLFTDPHNPADVQIEVLLTPDHEENEETGYEIDYSKPDRNRVQITFDSVSPSARLSDGIVVLNEVEEVNVYSVSIKLKNVLPGVPHTLWSRILAPTILEEQQWISQTVQVSCSCTGSSNQPSNLEGKIDGHMLCLRWKDNSYCDQEYVTSRKYKGVETTLASMYFDQCSYDNDCSSPSINCGMKESINNQCDDLFSNRYAMGETVRYTLQTKFQAESALAEIPISYVFKVPLVSVLDIKSDSATITVIINIDGKHFQTYEHQRTLTWEPHKHVGQFTYRPIDIVTDPSLVGKKVDITIKSELLQTLNCPGCSFKLGHLKKVSLQAFSPTGLDVIGGRVQSHLEIMEGCNLRGIRVCIQDAKSELRCQITDENGYYSFEVVLREKYSLAITALADTYQRTFMEIGCPNPNLEEPAFRYWATRPDSGLSSMYNHCKMVRDNTASKVQNDFCCGKDKKCTPTCKRLYEFATTDRYTDDDYKNTFHLTGCPNPTVSRSTLDHWITKSDSGREDMYKYCTLTRDGNASTRQRNTCCGDGISCRPTCTFQTSVAKHSMAMTTGEHNYKHTSFKVIGITGVDKRDVEIEQKTEYERNYFTLKVIKKDTPIDFVFHLKSMNELTYGVYGGFCKIPIGGYFEISNSYCPNYSQIVTLDEGSTANKIKLPALEGYKVTYIKRSVTNFAEDESSFDTEIDDFFFRHSPRRYINLAEDSATVAYVYDAPFQHEVTVKEATKCANSVLIYAEKQYEVEIKGYQNYSGAVCNSFTNQKIQILETDGMLCTEHESENVCKFDDASLSTGIIRFSIKTKEPKFNGDNLKKLEILLSKVNVQKITIPFLVEGIVKIHTDNTFIIPVPSHIPLLVLHEPPGDRSKTFSNGMLNMKEFSLYAHTNGESTRLLVKPNPELKEMVYDDIFRTSPSDLYFNALPHTNKMEFKDRGNWQTKKGEGDTFVLFNNLNIELFKANILEVEMVMPDNSNNPLCTANIYESIVWEFENKDNSAGMLTTKTEKEVVAKIRDRATDDDEVVALQEMLDANAYNLKLATSYQQTLFSFESDGNLIVQNIQDCYPMADVDFLNSIHLPINDCKEKHRLFSRVHEQVCTSANLLEFGVSTLCELSTEAMHLTLCGEGFSCLYRSFDQVTENADRDEQKQMNNFEILETLRIDGATTPKTYTVQFKNDAADTLHDFYAPDSIGLAEFMGLDYLDSEILLGLQTEVSHVTQDFTLIDKDEGDVIDMVVHMDPMYYTPAFETLGGVSSCPREKGTRSREYFSIYFSDTTPAEKSRSLKNIKKEEVITLSVDIQSYSNSLAGEYMLIASNVDELTLESTLLPFGKPFSLIQNETLHTDIIIKRQMNGTELVYDSIQIELTSLCDLKAVQDHIDQGDMIETNRGLLQVDIAYVEECASVEFKEDSLKTITINHADDGKEWAMLNMTIFGNDYFNEFSVLDFVQIQYREIDYNNRTVWRGIGHIKSQQSSRKTINGYLFDRENNINLQSIPQEINVNWYTDDVPDGRYELRIVSYCTYTGMDESYASKMMKVILDRDPPGLLSEPVFSHKQEILLAFDEIIDCNRNNLPYFATLSVLLKGQQKTITYNAPDVEDPLLMSSYCNFNTIKLQLSAEFPFPLLTDHQQMHLSLCGVQDIAGNVMSCIDIDFEFTKKMSSVTTSLLIENASLSKRNLLAQLLSTFKQLEINKDDFTLTDVLYLSDGEDNFRYQDPDSEMISSAYTDFYLDQRHSNDGIDIKNCVRVLISFDSWSKLYSFVNILKKLSSGQKELYLIDSLKHYEPFPILELIGGAEEDVKISPIISITQQPTNQSSLHESSQIETAESEETLVLKNGSKTHDANIHVTDDATKATTTDDEKDVETKKILPFYSVILIAIGAGVLVAVLAIVVVLGVKRYKQNASSYSNLHRTSMIIDEHDVMMDTL